LGAPSSVEGREQESHEAKELMALLGVMGCISNPKS